VVSSPAAAAVSAVPHQSFWARFLYSIKSGRIAGLKIEDAYLIKPDI